MKHDKDFLLRPYIDKVLSINIRKLKTENCDSRGKMETDLKYQYSTQKGKRHFVFLVHLTLLCPYKSCVPRELYLDFTVLSHSFSRSLGL